jgi:hypothetical protein
LSPSAGILSNMRRARSIVLAEREAERALEASAREEATSARKAARTRRAPMPSLTIRLPEDVRHALKERAAEMRTTPSTLARLLLAMGIAALMR